MTVWWRFVRALIVLVHMPVVPLDSIWLKMTRSSGDIASNLFHRKHVSLLYLQLKQQSLDMASILCSVVSLARPVAARTVMTESLQELLRQQELAYFCELGDIANDAEAQQVVLEEGCAGGVLCASLV